MSYKKHEYSKMYIDDANINLGDLRVQGNASVKNLMHKCVAVKKRGCK